MTRFCARANALAPSTTDRISAIASALRGLITSPDSNVWNPSTDETKLLLSSSGVARLQLDTKTTGVIGKTRVDIPLRNVLLFNRRPIRMLQNWPRDSSNAARVASGT